MTIPHPVPMFPVPGIDDIPPGTRMLIVAMVACAHLLLVWSWVEPSDMHRTVEHEMSASLFIARAAQAGPPGKPLKSLQPAPPSPKPHSPSRPKPVVSKPVQPQPNPVDEQAIVSSEAFSVPPEQPETATGASADAVLSSAYSASGGTGQPGGSGTGGFGGNGAGVGAGDIEPDYHAAYLNNPPPRYPMQARRMGWEGKVTLKVEVLASGLPGKITVYHSSGFTVLDNAALKAVRGWRFVAARHAGQPITRNFLVPIPFVLE